MKENTPLTELIDFIDSFQSIEYVFDKNQIKMKALSLLPKEREVIEKAAEAKHPISRLGISGKDYFENNFISHE